MFSELVLQYITSCLKMIVSCEGKFYTYQNIQTEIKVKLIKVPVIFKASVFSDSQTSPFMISLKVTVNKIWPKFFKISLFLTHFYGKHLSNFMEKNAKSEKKY